MIGRPILIPFVLALFFATCGAALAADDGFQNLFDGKTTKGWHKPFDWGKVWVEGVLTTDFRDKEDASGYIALQHHGESGKIYRFRNGRIKPLGGEQAVPPSTKK